ncbi:MAG: hypothetical protein FWB93_05040 [Oscillospiraceae bacterium]|nr:hypothetical protein [Oscillospiraceae bacterium]
MHSDPSYKGSENLEPTPNNGSALNCLLGTLGAIPGAIVAAVPMVIGLNFGWIVGWLAFLIPFGAAFGYEKLGGKRGFFRVLIVVISSLIGLLIGSLVGLSLFWSRDWALSFFTTFELVVDYFFYSADFRADLVVDMLLGIAGVGFGVWSALRREPAVPGFDGGTIIDAEGNVVPATTFDEEGNPASVATTTTEAVIWGEASGTAVGRITVTREKSFAGSAIKFLCVLNVSHPDFLAKTAGSGFMSKNEWVKNSPNLTKVKNGESVTIDIPYNVNKLYVVALTSTGKVFSNELIINAENMFASFNVKMKMGTTENVITLTQV